MASMKKTNVVATEKNFPNEEPKASTTAKKTGLTITGPVKVWKKTFTKQDGTAHPVFSLSVGRKHEDGEGYDNAYMAVFFSNACKPATDLDDGCYDITIKDAFFTVTKKGLYYVPAIMVKDWE